MVIGVDGNEANVDDKVGISEFAYRLISEFYKKKRQDLQFEIFLKEKPNKEMPKEDNFWQYRLVGPKPFWTQVGLPLALFARRQKPDVFFSPTHYAPRFSPIPRVISVMDLSFLQFPHLFNARDLHKLKRWTDYSVKKAARVITISQSSKDDIINEYNVPGDKVKVVYLGIKKEEKTKTMSETLSNHHIISPFILFVGTLQPRKNIEGLIHAFSKVKEKNPDLQLVIIGRKGWLYDEILAAPQKYGVEKDVKFLDFVKDEELPTFYKNAVCFVLPSLYEGFGLPVLEAMKYGCPVITSNISSMPEAGGDAALYVNPDNIEDIAEKIEKVVGDENLQETMRKKGLQQVKKFSWEKSANDVLAVLEDVWKSKPI